MITPELIARINVLARKKRTTGLSVEETNEQKKSIEFHRYNSRIEFVHFDNN